MNLQNAFEQFIQGGLYLRNWSARTPLIYRRAFTSFQQSLQERPEAQEPPLALTKAQLETWIVGLRQRGLSPAGINIYIRAMNSFCSWLKENDHTTHTVKLKQFKAHPKPVTTFSEAEIRALLSNKPKRLTYQRTWILIVLMLDTGCRIDEVLNLVKNDIDFDNLLLTVKGKGSNPN
jgi:integrase/recombinase XerD